MLCKLPHPSELLNLDRCLGIETKNNGEADYNEAYYNLK
jgi:hypothetical protein